MAEARGPKLHAIVYSWPRVQAEALAIAAALAGHVHRVSVVDSADEAAAAPEGVEVLPIGREAYFGRQFVKTIEAFAGDVLLQVAGDAACADWGALARSVSRRFSEIPGLGVLAPEIDGTHWTTEKVAIGPVGPDQLVEVFQSDCIVWAIRREIVEWLRTLDYSDFELGWGVDWAAIARARVTGLKVLRDLSVSVHHAQGAGYDYAQANEEMARFIGRLDPRERAAIESLQALQHD
jgi:hypothetical protein